MDFDQIAEMMADFDYHYALAHVTEMPDGTKRAEDLTHLIQATIIQLKLSKMFTGAEAEAHAKLASGLLQTIKSELKIQKPEIFKAKEAEKTTASAKPADTPETQKNNAPKDEKKDGEKSDWMMESAPDVTFDDIVGLEDVKRDIIETLSWPLQHKELMNTIKLDMNNRYLLYGPPGTGKTMIAKAIANFMMNANAKFYSIQCSNLISKYVGESEKNIKELFEQAGKEERAVIFMDEFDALCPKRSEGDNQVNNRIVAELLARTDGVSGKGNNTMLIMATNYPWRIDSAMLSRTGNRFYIPLPDETARKFTIKRKLGHLEMDGSVSVESLAASTDGFNHRDLNNLCAAIQKSLMRRCIESGSLVPVSNEDVEFARSTVKSSSNPAEVREMEKWIASME